MGEATPLADQRLAVREAAARSEAVLLADMLEQIPFEWNRPPPPAPSITQKASNKGFRPGFRNLQKTVDFFPILAENYRRKTRIIRGLCLNGPD